MTKEVFATAKEARLTLWFRDQAAIIASADPEPGIEAPNSHNRVYLILTDGQLRQLRADIDTWLGDRLIARYASPGTTEREDDER